MMLTPCSRASRMVATDLASSVPPHIQPPIAHVPSATRDTLSEVPTTSVASISMSSTSVVIVTLHQFDARQVGRAASQAAFRAGLLRLFSFNVGRETRFLRGDQTERRPV